jgi:flagellar P-ring protein precursor FlgI
VRIKDVSKLAGTESYSLVGYGLVVGLAGTGDSDEALSQQTIRNMLENFNIVVDTASLKAQNVAAVMVTATIAPPVHKGDTVRASVSSIGDAASLTGGELLLTPLLGEDGTTWAVGQGPVSVGGFDFGGDSAGGDRVIKNHPTSGVLINGVKLTRNLGLGLLNTGVLRLHLVQPDFTTAENMAEAINLRFRDSAMALDSATIQVRVPTEYQVESRMSGFIRDMEQLTFEPDNIAKVVMNERTGTIVFGGRVRISAVAISHGNLTVSIKNTEAISQPAPFTRGGNATTERLMDQQTAAVEEATPIHLMPDITTVNDLVTVLNALGATPRDIMVILRALKESGALHATLEAI